MLISAISKTYESHPALTSRQKKASVANINFSLELIHVRLKESRWAELIIKRRERVIVHLSTAQFQSPITITAKIL